MRSRSGGRAPSGRPRLGDARDRLWVAYRATPWEVRRFSTTWACVLAKSSGIVPVARVVPLATSARLNSFPNGRFDAGAFFGGARRRCRVDLACRGIDVPPSPRVAMWHRMRGQRRKRWLGPGANGATIAAGWTVHAGDGPSPSAGLNSAGAVTAHPLGHREDHGLLRPLRRSHC